LYTGQKDALEEMARDIALIESDPEDWGWYVTYLLEKMEEEANKVRNSASYEALLNDLRDVLDVQIKANAK
jgi:glycine cleavage system H lipoate-binding protein